MADKEALLSQKGKTLFSIVSDNREVFATTQRVM